MIKFSMHGKRTLIGFGISRQNVKALIGKPPQRKPNPIMVALEELDPRLKGIDLLLFYEPTDVELVKVMEQYVGPDTITHGGIDPETGEFAKSTRH